MAIMDLFSKQAKARRGELPDVYRYDELPQPVRVQIVHIVRDALGDASAYQSKTTEFLKFIHDTLCREYGVFALAQDARHRGPDYESDVYNHFLKEPDTERALDFVELAFRVVDRLCRDWDFENYSRPKISPDDAIQELNARMRYHGVGYQYESGELIRVDSQLVHQ